MRDISTALETSINSDTNSPAYLVALTLDGGIVKRFSSRGALFWDGNDWGGFVDVSSITHQAGGVLSASMNFTLDEMERDATNLTASPVTVEIWQGDSGEYAYTFKGRSTRISITDSGVEIKSRNWSDQRQVIIAPPFVSYITPPGTVVEWGGQRIILNT